MAADIPTAVANMTKYSILEQTGISSLARSGQCMHRMTAPDEEGARAVAAYRVQVERLRGLLPSIHGALLRERARLAQEQERLRSMTSWAEASQQSL